MHPSGEALRAAPQRGGIGAVAVEQRVADKQGLRLREEVEGLNQDMLALPRGKPAEHADHRAGPEPDGGAQRGKLRWRVAAKASNRKPLGTTRGACDRPPSASNARQVAAELVTTPVASTLAKCAPIADGRGAIRN